MFTTLVRTDEWPKPYFFASLTIKHRWVAPQSSAAFFSSLVFIKDYNKNYHIQNLQYSVMLGYLIPIPFCVWYKALVNAVTQKSTFWSVAIVIHWNTHNFQSQSFWYEPHFAFTKVHLYQCALTLSQHTMNLCDTLECKADESHWDLAVVTTWTFFLSGRILLCFTVKIKKKMLRKLGKMKSVVSYAQFFLKVLWANESMTPQVVVFLPRCGSWNRSWEFWD